MELPLQLCKNLRYFPHNYVSILVLMELPLQPQTPRNQLTKRLKNVSILVLMELPLQQYGIIKVFSDNIVSILVLMELPLQPEFEVVFLFFSRRFQSLF